MWITTLRRYDMWFASLACDEAKAVLSRQRLGKDSVRCSWIFLDSDMLRLDMAEMVRMASFGSRVDVV